MRRTHRASNWGAGRRRSIRRILLDFALWVGAAALASAAGSPLFTALAAFAVGAVPLHDVLVHGHEGTHGLIARRRWVNELFTWLTHALVGISGTAYRAFHLDHHRLLGTERDPEYRLLHCIAKGAPGWAYLGIPLFSHLWVNAYPFRRGASPRVRWLVVRDAAGMALLHGVLAAGLGAKAYLCFVVLPVFTGLSAAVVLRSVSEHHGTEGTDRWTNTRTTSFGTLFDFLWSNTGYHLEHHLFPFVPYHRLPDVRHALRAEMARRGSAIAGNFPRTAIGLLREPVRFQSKEVRHARR